MKAVVTGANGFVGSSIVKELSKYMDVLAVVKDERSDISRIREAPENVKVVYCNAEEILRLPTIVPDGEYDLFFHFAWYGTSGSIRADVDAQLSNVQITCDAVSAAAAMRCRRFIYAGSIMEYEAAEYCNVDGAKPGEGTVYSAAKLAADMMARTKATRMGIDYISVIISNIYGKNEKSARFLNNTIRKMLKNEPIEMTEGKQMYDFIYLEDAVRAIVQTAMSDKISNEAVYIGNKNQKQLREYVEEMKAVLGSKSELMFGSVPYNGKSLTYDEFDTAKLEDVIGYKTEVTFSEGVKLVAESIRDNHAQSFGIETTELEGVYQLTPFYMEDNRGNFLKAFEKDVFREFGLDADIQEEFESFSSYNVIRGLHFQTKNPQIKIVRVLQGEVIDVVVDLRAGSPTFGQYTKIRLSGKNHKSLWIPAGFAHGFRVVSGDGALMSYKCIGRYEKGYDTGILWSDTDLSIDWEIVPGSDLIISDRDKQLMRFSEFVETYGGL